MRSLITIALVFLVGCLPTPYTNHPVAKALQSAVQHPVAPEAFDIVRDTRCDQQPNTFEAAMAKLTVPILETRIVPGTMTAAPFVLLAKRGWKDRTKSENLTTLKEELAHYCQRQTFPGFDQLWATGHVDRPCKVENGKCVGVVVPRSDYRAAFEIAAKRAAGVKPDIKSLTEFYLLYDLEPESLQALIEAQ